MESRCDRRVASMHDSFGTIDAGFSERTAWIRVRPPLALSLRMSGDPRALAFACNGDTHATGEDVPDIPARMYVEDAEYSGATIVISRLLART